MDESENRATGVYAVGGFVARAEVWHGLETEWLQQLPKEISCFHATDCFTGSNEFRIMDWQQRTALLDVLTDVLVAYDIRLIGHAIASNAYREFAPKPKVNEFLGNKYAAAFGGAVELACNAMGNAPTPSSIRKIYADGERWEKCGFFIERNEYTPSAIDLCINNAMN